MARRFMKVLAVSFLLALLSGALGQTIPRDVRLQILEAVVQIIPFDPQTGETAPWSGSGTIISRDGHILTNFHVIGDLEARTHFDWHAVLVTDPAFTDQPPRFAYWARYVAGDPTHDLAILKIEELADESPVPEGTVFPAVAVGDSNTLLPGDGIVIVGYPGISGSTITFTSGTMSGWVGEDFETGGKGWIKTDAKIAHGNSGGAAFDLDGTLIGVPTAGRTVQYAELDVEEQAYIRPIGLAWAVIGPNVPGVLRAAGAAPPSRAAQAPVPDPTTPGAVSAAPPSAAAAPGGATAGGAPSGDYGAVTLGVPISARLAAAGEEGYTFHGYTVSVPPGTGPIVISVDGRGNDVDLAVSSGGPIADYEAVEHLDVSEEANPSYRVEAPGGTVYFDVLNLLAGPVDYTVTVQAERPASAPASSAEVVASSTSSATVGALSLGQSAKGTLAGADGAAPYHTYWVDVPPGTTQVVVRMTADADLDLAAKLGGEIDSYTAEGNWDWIDTSTSAVSEFVIPATGGRLYIDVFNALGAGTKGAYTLTVR